MPPPEPAPKGTPPAVVSLFNEGNRLWRLGQLPDAASTSRLLGYARCDDPTLRLASLRALANIGDLQATEQRTVAGKLGLPVDQAPRQERQVPLVMVVDDSLTMRKVTGRILERHNFEVSVARDGVEALERLEERVPDLMLLDIEMPRMDGYELATAMRADPRYKDVPIVMITSRSGDKHRQRAFEIGVQRYLGKPYQELDLMRNVYDLLGIARARE